MSYNAVIGLEVHVELLTRMKLFCSCPTEFGARPNTQVCPVCLGLPGSLPVLNSEAVTQALRAALALGCRINRTSTFARKHYFYPDLPKGYQITQHTRPLAQGGKVDVDGFSVTIARLHIEEDSGKLTHTEDSTLVDYNRSGIPLAEIVTEPCLKSPIQARAFLENLKQIMEYIGASDCKMEEGSLRCDANISLHASGQSWARTEIKNLNSFRSVERALDYEAKRQSQLLDQGREVLPQTLRWDEKANRTVPMRSKEQAVDYQYFPEPDLPPLNISEVMVQKEADYLPELPRTRIERYAREYAISRDDADVLTRSRATADWFEQTVAAGAEPRHAANWLTGEVSRLLNRNDYDIRHLPFGPHALASLIELSQRGVISGTAAKQVLAKMFASGDEPEEIVRRLGLAQINDAPELKALVRQVIDENPDAVEDFRAGRDRAIRHLMGQAMKLSRGKANPEIVRKLMLQSLTEET